MQSVRLAAILFATFGVAAQEIEDSSTQAFGMHDCPAGYAMSGAHVDQNRFLCRPTHERDQDCFVDYATQRSEMHACPAGTYMRGLHGGRNELTCCFERSRGFTAFSQPEFLDSGTQGHSMHVCPNAVMTGIHIARNQFLCRAIPATPPPIPNPITISVTEDRNRSFLPAVAAGANAGIWQAATRNWLSRILDVPIDGSWRKAPAL